ncbi:hypothetical protein B0H16DRAFT_281669 [Mycena metata]|uniref:Uncharacterized protein n=1 Tax=Mycena metata TaxID=1033252 RepID=A0AAD7HPG7_9AGAR|nr:hypothetical protein B0H16DRAFT_281669 [Mycena metata]
MNPFSQGWSYPSSYNAPQNTSWAANPSMYGALPYTAPPNSTPNAIEFTFVPSNGSILNSIVTGPQSQTYFRITTDSTKSGFSIVQNPRLESIAMIEWRKHPVVEIFGILSKRNSAQFLALSYDKTHRVMNVRGRNFRWMPDARHVGLYSVSPVNPQFFGKISQSQDGTTFEVTAEGLQLGLLEVFVVSALLLMCGRNID